MKNYAYLMVLVLSIFFGACQSDQHIPLEVSKLFSNHMVLQQLQDVNFWGTNAPGQEVHLSASWGTQASAVADENGKWKITVETPSAGGPYTIQIESEKQLTTIEDVLIGEVWVASGQSNMDLPLKGWPPQDTVCNSAQEIAHADFPEIRFFKVPFNIATTPQDSVDGKWERTSPETAGDFSVTAYFYAKKLYQELHVPIGIIQSSIGGTPAEAWTSKESLKKMGDFDENIDGLEELQSSITEWNNKWPVTQVPRSDDDWSNIQWSDMDATSSDFDDINWESMHLPGRFDRLQSGEFDGAIWLRTTFNIQDVETDYMLRIGSIDDMDETFVNGQKVGGIMENGNANTPREMMVPAKILKAGINTLAIRAIDTGGPGFINGPIILSSSNGEEISLEGEWKSKLVAENISGNFFKYGLEADISARPNVTKLNSNSPTVLFNAMIHPLISYSIKGVIWYQGESNVGRADQYKTLFPLMIDDWRQQWNQELPFYFVQIAPYLYQASNQKGQSPKLRNAQRYALKLPKTGMAVTLDIGKLSTAHPAYKKEVGDRLARFALANEYGQELTTSGPLFKNIEVSGNKLLVEFESKSIGSGLVAGETGLTGFEIAGADKKFVPANAKILGDKIQLSSHSVSTPVYVRYAWSDGAAATLFNKEGLPAGTFTSEE
ncbi:sialate O-acetylesterase [Sunxiuqinia sp. A32]|uniref:sialate O-acetylesterase n=1 Tax=Sunxiuqinia sp. A32 TaxID=3461496 RepID=UPI00404654C5